MPPMPTDAELDILAVLWRRGASTVREVHEELGKNSGYTTTLKQMQMMMDRGLVVRNERFRSHSTKPLFQKRTPGGRSPNVLRRRLAAPPST